MTRRFAATIRFLSLAASAALLTACAFDQPAQQETKTGWRPHFEIEAEQMKRFEAERDRIGERLREKAHFLPKQRHSQQTLELAGSETDDETPNDPAPHPPTPTHSDRSHPDEPESNRSESPDRPSPDA